MKHYLKILSFAKPHLRDIILSVVFNILLVVFSLASITILIPVLKIIFENTTAAPDPIPYPGILEIKNYIVSNLNYWIYNVVQELGPKKVLFRIISFGFILIILKNLFRYLAALYLTFLKNKVERDIRKTLYDASLNFDLAYLNEQKKGDLLTKMSTDIQEIQWTVLTSLKRIVMDPLMILLTLLLLFIFSFKLTMFVLVTLPFTAFLISKIGKTLKAPSLRAKEELANILSHMEETFSGFQIIKSFVSEKRSMHKFDELNENYLKHMNDTLRRKELSSPISEILGFIVVSGIILYGGILILDQNELDPSIFITYIALFYQIIAPSKTLSNAFYDIKRGEASAERILNLLEIKPKIKNAENAALVNDFQHSIKFDNVFFKYELSDVLKGISFQVDKGTIVALIGESGSGKSTIASLLSRFYDVESGAIEIDGVNIKSLNISSLRKLIAYIAQDSFLFHDTVRNNIALGDSNLSEEEIIKAAKISNAHDFIIKMENGYDTIVGDRGVKLSGGQRQRIAIARAVIKDAPILVLDEATSSLDAESEQLVQEAFDRIMQNKTSIVIAHRLSTIKHVQQIIVLKDGKIIERGKHEELIKTKGEYSKFVDLQRF